MKITNLGHSLVSGPVGVARSRTFARSMAANPTTMAVFRDATVMVLSHKTPQVANGLVFRADRGTYFLTPNVGQVVGLGHLGIVRRRRNGAPANNAKVTKTWGGNL